MRSGQHGDACMLFCQRSDAFDHLIKTLHLFFGKEGLQGVKNDLGTASWIAMRAEE